MSADHITWPMAPAESYAWPGGYPIAYLADDGEYLCAACINDPSNPVHIGQDGISDGWRIVGLQVLEGSAADYDGGVACAHCGRELVAEDETDADADERPVPDESDDYISDDRGGYAVSHGGRYVGTYARYSRAVAALYLARAADDVWPNVWQVNERGNMELMAFNGHNLVAVGIGYV